MKSGVINLLKPPGMTSSDAVLQVRRLFGQKRVGHTGTLDPGAAGVLPICIGRATRLFDYLVDKDKVYIAEIRFGAATDTQDSYGQPVWQADTAVTADMLSERLPDFLGEQEQIAPMYSAVKSGGKKLYELARAGAAPVEKRRRVTIHALELLEQTGGQSFLLRVACSRGTYVRTLCQDIGEALGAPAHLSFLLRCASGPFLVEEAWTLEELWQLKEEGRLDAALLPADVVLSDLPEIRLSRGEEERRLRNGAVVFPAGWEEFPQGLPLRTYGTEGFLGLSRADKTGLHLILCLEDERKTDE